MHIRSVYTLISLVIAPTVDVSEYRGEHATNTFNIVFAHCIYVYAVTAAAGLVLKPAQSVCTS
jgi:hypothetical protein